MENDQFLGIDFEESPQMVFAMTRKFERRTADAEGDCLQCVHSWEQLILAVGDVVWCLQMWKLERSAGMVVERDGPVAAEVLDSGHLHATCIIRKDKVFKTNQ